jgi:hypothetical protein
MNRLHELAKLLVCCWILGDKDPQPLPTSHGILDRALQLVKDQAILPAWVWDELHFADSRVGLQCVELPEILDWAQTAELTQVPNPSYQTTTVKINAAIARRLLGGLNVAPELAAAWGKALREAARQAVEEFSAP